MTPVVHHSTLSQGVLGAETEDWNQVTCPACLIKRPKHQEQTMSSIPFTLTNENITIILDGKPVVIHAGSPQFHGLRDALFREDWAVVPTYASAAGALQQWLGDKFVVDGNAISYEGVPLPESLRERIWAMVRANESPGPLFRFYERLHKNPSFRSRTQLFSFLQHTGIPIEPDGTFLAYKGVKHDYTDGYTGKVDNSPGITNTMARHLISDDPDVACHYGYHVGALGYAGTFSNRTVICRVDPEHVVCVPRDYSAQKMRVCEYTVIGNHDGVTEMPSTTFTPDVEEHDDPEWGGEVEGEDQDEVENPDHNPDDANEPKAVLTTKKPKPTGPRAASFNRMNPGKLMEQSIDDLRKYAAAHLKIIGASKLPGGKSALVSKILKVRRRRRS